MSSVAGFSLVVSGVLVVAVGLLLRQGWMSELAEDDVFSFEDGIESYLGIRSILIGAVVVAWGVVLSTSSSEVLYWLGFAAVAAVFYWTFLGYRDRSSDEGRDG